MKDSEIENLAALWWQARTLAEKAETVHYVRKLVRTEAQFYSFDRRAA